MTTTTSFPTESPFASLLPVLWRVPVLSERVAARLFLTPLGRLAPEERALPEAPGRSEWLVGHRRLHVRVYGAGSPVLVVHGWGGQGQQMSGFVDPLVERGHQVLVVDLPAHGESEGSQTNVVEASDALLAVVRRYGAPAGVIAHSFGAAAVVVAAQRGLTTHALAFVAPLPSLDVGVRQFAARAALPLPVLDRASRLIEQRCGMLRGALDLAEVGERLRIPLLIVHDQDDRTVALEHSLTVAERWPGARLLTTSGLGHRRILRNPEVQRCVAAFLEQGTCCRSSELERRFGES